LTSELGKGAMLAEHVARRELVSKGGVGLIGLLYAVNAFTSVATLLVNE